MLQVIHRRRRTQGQLCFLDRRNTHCNTTFPASQWQAPKGVAAFPSGSESKNSFAPLYCIERVTVSFFSCKDVADIFMFLSAFTNTSTEIPLSESCNYVSDTDACSL